MDKVNIGIIGFGTVGVGVIKALKEKSVFLQKKAGVKIRVKKICDINLRRRRDVNVNKRLLTKDPNQILQDPDIGIVVELVGGIHPAKEIIINALNNKKHVVTANKALLAQEGKDIFKAAEKNGMDIYFGASVAGGVPIIKALRESLVANRIDAIFGIVNGTSNYILTEMSREGYSFSKALQEAKKHGYAEKRPSLDIKGVDSAHKLVLLALLGFGKFVKMEDIYIEGILDISDSDIKYAKEFGYRVKLLAIAKAEKGELEVRVHPTLLSKEHLLSNVSGVYNAVYVHGDMIGSVLFYGRGAGRNPAASAVVADIVDLARNLKLNAAGRVPPYSKSIPIKKIKEIDEIESRYYIRFSAVDVPGVLAKISGILGRYGISIASVAQKERKQARIVPIVMMTHEAREKSMRKALAEIDRLSAIKRKSVAIRVER